MGCLKYPEGIRFPKSDLPDLIPSILTSFLFIEPHLYLAALVCLPPGAQKYDSEMYKLVMPCLCAIAGAIPPDYVDASYSSKTEKKASVDAEGNFDPKPIETLK